MLEKKLAEVARKYELPRELLDQVIAMEREKLTLQNRRLTPKILELIAQHADLAAPPAKDGE